MVSRGPAAGVYRRTVVGRARSSWMALRQTPEQARLRAAGVAIGEKVSLQRGVLIDENWGWLVSIGSWSTLAPRVMILAHDASMKRATGFTKVAPVAIGERVFIGAGSIVLPGVTIGDGAIVGAGSVVSRDVPAATVAAGNPARVLGEADDFTDRRLAQIDAGPVFEDLQSRRGTREWRDLQDDAARQIQRAGIGWVR